jgi:hypothetical protein
MTDVLPFLRGCDDPLMRSAADEVERLRAENAELKASVRLLTASLRTTDQPAACQHDFRHYMVGFNETGETRCRVCGFVVGTADQQAASMQDAPQPTEGTGKQSMQAACTKNDAGLVQRDLEDIAGKYKQALDRLADKS